MVDVKSAIARLGLGATSFRPEAESPIEYLAWFRFPVTWTYLIGPVPETESAVAPKPVPASPALALAPIAPAPPPRNVVPNVVALDVVGVDDGIRATGSAARWEMMVPKMTRPTTAGPVANLGAAAAPALAPPSKVLAHLPAPVNSPVIPVFAKTATESLPSQFVAPSFSFHTPEDQFVARYWPQIVYVAIAIAAIGCLIWGLSAPSPAAHSATSSTVSTPIWSRPPLSLSGRSLTVYEPSLSESDYRMEFSWVPNSGGIGWVFRTRDANNYYAAHLGLEQHAAGAVLVAEHFSVIAGTESPHSRKVIPVPVNAGLLRVHMDAIGSTFKLFLENNPADIWTDARLKSGALGFYDDGDHHPKLLALSFTFIDNAISRTSVVPLP